MSADLVPYNGTQSAQIDLMAGEIDILFESIAPVRASIIKENNITLGN